MADLSPTYGRVLQMIEAAALAGEPCPSNAAIVEAMGYGKANKGSLIVSRLESLGLIEVVRTYKFRRVHVLADGPAKGKWTAPPGAELAREIKAESEDTAKRREAARGISGSKFTRMDHVRVKDDEYQMPTISPEKLKAVEPLLATHVRNEAQRLRRPMTDLLADLVVLGWSVYCDEVRA